MSALCLRCVQAAAAFLGAVAVLIIPLPPPCAAAPPSPAVRRTLPSGMRIIVAEQTGTKLAALDLRIRVGSGSETPATNGTAHFIEHLLFKGTNTRRRGEIDQAIEELGGELKAQTTRDATRLATVLPAGNWRQALAVVADMTLHPAFRSEDVAAEKAVILSEMAIARTEPRRASFEALAEIAFDPNDPYRLPLMGTEAGVKAMTAESLRTFWSHWYRPENMTLVITGGVKSAEVLDEVERLFPGTPLPLKKSEMPVFAPSVAIARSELRNTGAENLTTVFIGFRAPSAFDADAAAAVAALVSLLAERADGGSSYGRLRDALITQKGLAISATADYVAQRGESLVVLSVTGPHATAGKMEAALLAELEKLPAGGFTADDAAQARQNLLQAHASDGTVEGKASRLALADVLSLSPEETDDSSLYAARLLKTITPQSLARAASQYLSPDSGAIVLVRPAGP